MESVSIPAAAAATAMVLRPNGKDSRWLTLEVCPEFLRSSCHISEEECKFAHPPSHVEIQNGRVTCCYDSIKGKCSRTNPPCKYLHPPAHLKDQLLETGRQNLIQKNLHTAAMASSLQQMMPMSGAIFPLVVDNTGYKQVIPSNYQTMVVPGQYPFMQPSIAQPYAIQSSAGLPLQYLNPQQAGYSGRYIQMVNPSANTLSIPAINAAPAGAAAHVPMATLLPSVPGAGVYGPQMAALASPLTNQMELCYLPDNSYATYQASSYSSSIGELNNRQVTSANSNSSSSAVNNQFVETVSTAASDAAQSYSIATSYPMPVAYQATQVLENSTSTSRKRTREAIMAANGATLVPVLKRQALMDGSSGLPIYQTYSGSNPYQPMAITTLPPQQFFPISHSDIAQYLNESFANYVCFPSANNPAMLPHFQ